MVEVGLMIPAINFFSSCHTSSQSAAHSRRLSFEPFSYYRIPNANYTRPIKIALRYLQGKKPLPVKSAPEKNECRKKRRPHHKGSALYKSFRFVAVSYLRRRLVTP